MAADDHDAIIRLEEQMRALQYTWQTQEKEFDRRLQRIEEKATEIADIAAHRITRPEHDELIRRIGLIELQQSAETGGTASRYSLLLVVAVLLTLAGLIFTTVHLISS